MSEQSESGCHCAGSSEVRERTGDESLRKMILCLFELGTALRRRGGDEVMICGYANQLTVFRRRVTAVSVEQKREAQGRFSGRSEPVSLFAWAEETAGSIPAARIICGIGVMANT